jgi:hypothetical protein
MITNKIELVGTLDVTVTDSNGNVVDSQHLKNLVVDAGKELVANRLKDNTQDAITHIAIGTDGTAAAGGQTELLGEVARGAVAIATVTANAVAYSITYGAGVGTGTLLEAGLFNDAAVGTMLSRTASINVVKGATDTLTIVWTVAVN